MNGVAMLLAGAQNDTNRERRELNAKMLEKKGRGLAEVIKTHIYWCCHTRPVAEPKGAPLSGGEGGTQRR